MTRSRLIALALIAAAAYGGYRLWIALRSDETRIHLLAEGIESAFNDASAGTIREALAPSFRERSSGLERDQIFAVLVRLFFTARDPQTKAPLYLVRIEPGTERIEVTKGDPPRARLALTARFTQRAPGGGEPRAVGVIEFDGDLEKIDGEWKLTTGGAKIIEGRWPSL